jgi:hypothetical protein
MSLVVLKRKSQTKYGKVLSRPGVGFNINNPRRVESKSGPGRHQMQTPMRGLSYRGHGGCCGTFKGTPILSQYVNSDPHVANHDNPKSTSGISVKNHHGSMAVRHKWIRGGTYPNVVVKDVNPVDYEQYVRNKALKYGAKEPCGQGQVDETITKHCAPCTVSNIVKNVDTLSHSEYLRTEYMNKNCLPPSNDKLPYPRAVRTHCGVGCSNGDDDNINN